MLAGELELLTGFRPTVVEKTGANLPVAGDIPAGYGHLYTSGEYLSGWVGISRPDGWTDADDPDCGAPPVCGDGQIGGTAENMVVGSNEVYARGDWHMTKAPM